MRDFNCGNINWNTVQPETASSSSDTELFLECIENNCLTQHIIEPTRSVNTLDLPITKDPDIVHSINVLDCLAESDHRMVLSEMDIKQLDHKQTEALHYNKGVYEDIRQHSCGINWNTNLTSDIENRWQAFRDLILQLHMHTFLSNPLNV